MKPTSVLYILSLLLSASFAAQSSAPAPELSIWAIATSVGKIGAIEKTKLVDLTPYEVAYSKAFRDNIGKLTSDDINGLLAAAHQLQPMIAQAAQLADAGSSTIPGKEQLFQMGVGNGLDSVIKLRCLFALYNENMAHKKSASGGAIAALVSKGKERGKGHLVFKGLYLGMPIGDAAKLLTHYCERPLEVTRNGDSLCIRIQNPTLAGIPNASLVYDVDVIVARTEAGDDSVFEFRIPSYVSDVLFASSAQDARTFAQNFAEAYKIPSMKSETKKLMNKSGSEVVGSQSTLVYRGSTYELTIFDSPVFIENDDPTAMRARSFVLVSRFQQKKAFD